eukprot:8251401-Pyramimonas_sp.AAC.1
MSQMTIIWCLWLSNPTAATARPSAETSSAHIPEECPHSSAAHVPAAKSHTRTMGVLPSWHVASTLPSPEKASATMAAVCPKRNRCAPVR